MVQREGLLENCAIKPATLIIDIFTHHVDCEMNSLFIAIDVSEDEVHFPLTLGYVSRSIMVYNLQLQCRLPDQVHKPRTGGTHTTQPPEIIGK